MAYRVAVAHDTCVSSGKCVADHPEAFGFDEDELAVVLPGAAELDDEQLLKAARRCPSSAIQVFAGDGTPVEV